MPSMALGNAFLNDTSVPQLHTARTAPHRPLHQVGDRLAHPGHKPREAVRDDPSAGATSSDYASGGRGAAPNPGTTSEITQDNTTREKRIGDWGGDPLTTRTSQPDTGSRAQGHPNGDPTLALWTHRPTAPRGRAARRSPPQPPPDARQKNHHQHPLRTASDQRLTHCSPGLNRHGSPAQKQPLALPAGGSATSGPTQQEPVVKEPATRSDQHVHEKFRRSRRSRNADSSDVRRLPTPAYGRRSTTSMRWPV
jgi:hypothetical protein